MIKKFTAGSVALMFMLFLFGSVANVLAAPPEDRASQNQACDNASETGKANASGNSVLSDCEAPASEPPADEPPAIDCSDPIVALSNPDLCGV